jgi:hypothetical protein
MMKALGWFCLALAIACVAYAVVQFSSEDPASSRLLGAVAYFAFGMLLLGGISLLVGAHSATRRRRRRQAADSSHDSKSDDASADRPID